MIFSTNSGQFYVWLSFLFSLTVCDRYWYPYCNKNPSQYSIEPLPTIDKSHISTLSQLHVFTRHGSRTTSNSISSYFPSVTDEEFVCNITTVETRNFNSNGDFMSLRKNYVDNEELLEGNCQDGQSVTDLIMQHTTNAQHIKQAYFGNETFHLWTKEKLYLIGHYKYDKQTINNRNRQLERKSKISHLVSNSTNPEISENDNIKNNIDSIINNINRKKHKKTKKKNKKKKKKKFSFNSENRKRFIDSESNGMYFESTDFERTLASAVIFLSEFLDVYDSSSIFDINVHDQGRDPWNPDNSQVCSNAGDWYFNYTESSDEYMSLYNSDWRYSVEDEWNIATNSTTFFSVIGISTLPIYCIGNIDIPIFDNEKYGNIYSNAVNFSYAVKNAIYHNNDKSAFASKLMSGPLSYDLLTQINSLSLLDENENEKGLQFVLHSTHDNTLMYFLEAFGIFDGVQPIFGEMITLEIYLKKENENRKVLNEYEYEYDDYDYDDFVFRWIRNGKFLQFPGCNYQNGTQLCNLTNLINVLQDVAMPLQQWEVYCNNVTSS